MGVTMLRGVSPVEGNHLILDLHHVAEAAPDHLPCDLAFVASGII